MTVLQCAGKSLDLRQPQVMGILNVTPDSFSDGGRFSLLDNAIAQAEQMAEAGAAIIDIGGESTRPGAAEVGAAEELDRVIPVIEALATRLNIPLSIDTSKPEVMSAAAAAGVGLINDVAALQRPAALEAAAASGLPVCLMHMQGAPRTMQQNPVYTDVVTDVHAFLRSRTQACVEAGIPLNNILLDPGFGFGKTLQHNLQLLRHLSRLNDDSVAEPLPLLVGLSRKSMINSITPTATAERLPGSLALALQAVRYGASVLRVHDVAETVQALRVWQAVDSVKFAS